MVLIQQNAWWGLPAVSYVVPMLVMFWKDEMCYVMGWCGHTEAQEYCLKWVFRVLQGG